MVQLQPQPSPQPQLIRGARIASARDLRFVTRTAWLCRTAVLWVALVGVLRTAVLWVVLVGVLSQPCRSAEYTISPDTDLKPLLNKVVAGDVIVFKNGEWRNCDLKFELLSGTAKAPITIRAQTPGKVILTGRTVFRFSGTHVVVSGLVFRNPRGMSDVVQFRTHSQRLAQRCRMTDCVFEESKESEAGIESRWLSLYGSNNRVDHCYFAGKKNKGTTLVVWIERTSSTSAGGNNQIDHNSFGPRPELGRNGGETIRIGTSETSELTSSTLVTNNFFYRCNGEAETISSKSCENHFRHNVFDECSGTLTLRHGHRCHVDGNTFLGRKSKGTGGVRIIGTSHVVTNNYFEGLRGDAERAAVCMMNGVPNSPLNQYAPVSDAVVAHNSFVDCKVSLEIGVGATKKQSVAPTSCSVTHNVFLPGKWEISRVHADPINFIWRANLRQQSQERSHALEKIANFEIRDLGFKRAADGLMRPTDANAVATNVASKINNDFDGGSRNDQTVCGCHIPDATPRVLASASNTGPRWLQK